MGGDNHIRSAHKRVVCRRRLHRKHVQRRASHNLVVQGLGQGDIINDAPPRDVDNTGTFFDLAEGLCAKDALQTSTEARRVK